MIKIISAIALVAVSVIPATSFAKEGKDGYYYRGEEYNKETVTVSVRWYDTSEELVAAGLAVNAPIDDKGQLRAFSIINPNTNVCTIHALKPTTRFYYPEVIGHEMMHCFKGRFHTTNHPDGEM